MSRNTVALTFTNTADRSCNLRGFPRVSFVNAAGQRVGADATMSSVSPPSVVLRSGQSASATLVQMDVDVYQGCDYPAETAPASALQIYAPGAATPAMVPYESNVCTSATIKQSSVTAVGSST